MPGVGGVGAAAKNPGCRENGEGSRKSNSGPEKERTPRSGRDRCGGGLWKQIRRLGDGWSGNRESVLTGRRFGLTNFANKLIALAGNGWRSTGFHGGLPQDFAQGRDVLGEVDFFDERIRRIAPS